MEIKITDLICLAQGKSYILLPCAYHINHAYFFAHIYIPLPLKSSGHARIFFRNQLPHEWNSIVNARIHDDYLYISKCANINNEMHVTLKQEANLHTPFRFYIQFSEKVTEL